MLEWGHNFNSFNIWPHFTNSLDSTNTYSLDVILLATNNLLKCYLHTVGPFFSSHEHNSIIQSTVTAGFPRALNCAFTAPLAPSTVHIEELSLFLLPSRQWADCGESLCSSNDLWLLQAESRQETPAAAVYRRNSGEFWKVENSDHFLVVGVCQKGEYLLLFGWEKVLFKSKSWWDHHFCRADRYKIVNCLFTS